MWQEKGYPTRRKSVRTDHVNMRDEKRVANVLAQVLPVGRTAQKRGRDSIVLLGLGNPGRGEDPEDGQRGSKSVTAAPTATSRTTSDVIYGP